MTPSEEEALNEAKAILRLHFDAFTITTRVTDDSSSGTGDRINSDWHGALSDVIGIHRITALRLDALALSLSGRPEVK